MKIGPYPAAPTMEFFVPVTYGTEMVASDFRPVAKCDAVDEVAYVSFKVPHDFTSIINAELIVQPAATQAAADWGIYARYAAIGEMSDTHNESDNTTTYNVTVNKLFAIDISGILSNLAADDNVGVMFRQGSADHNVFVLGVRFKYN